MSNYAIDMDAYKASARLAVAEGCVLLRNENQTLPLQKGDHVAVFGRMAANYYKSGLGSGGLVNTRYVTGILDALKESEDIKLDKKLLKCYEEFNASHPLDQGMGWGTVPWSQEEMEIDEDLVADRAENDDVALVIIGRTAGEDEDNAAKEGSYLLTQKERDLIEKVAKHFKRCAVLLNVGNIIDMKWVEELSVPSVMYVWQGGQEGGNGVADVLLGETSPSGKLTDTIAKDIADYPSTANFGDEKRNYYAEDIYVGYRYFETFAKDQVLYPFGYGLSYTEFETRAKIAGDSDSRFISVEAEVKNIGDYYGKEVVQVYVKAPQGKLGKPVRVLVGFDKTRELAPEDRTTVMLMIPKYNFASFDDSGVTGHKNAYVLEAGTYEFYVGSDVRSAALAGSYEQEFAVLDKLKEAYAPTAAMQRMRPGEEGEKGFAVAYEETPLRTVSPYERMKSLMPEEISYTGDKGFTLRDVFEENCDMDTFIAQLSAEEMIMLFRGEGMSCPKVTAGTGSGFGGLCEATEKWGIPATCTTDGPSGLRMDCGTKAFSLPNGTSLGCSFNLPLIEELYSFTGKELRRNRVDALLGPGMNIHRNPLNGRNFEYISEDPLLTGKAGAAMVRGLSCVGSTGTIKHFCSNNQEFRRNDVEGVISQRALREIYLKGFEIAVKEGKARSVMTTYGPVNGIWTASSYDLNTTILRREWGFDGIVMTDWWAKGNVEGTLGARNTRASMIAAGNDLYMCSVGQADMDQDDVLSAFEDGRITLAQLQENTRHILSFILKSPAMLYQMDAISQEELDERAEVDADDIDPTDIETIAADPEGTLIITDPEWNTDRGQQKVFATDIPRRGIYSLKLTVHSDLNDLAQLPVSVYFDNALKGTPTFQGSSGAQVSLEVDLGVIFGPVHYVKLYFGGSGLVIDELKIYFREELVLPPGFEF